MRSLSPKTDQNPSAKGGSGKGRLLLAILLDLFLYGTYFFSLVRQHHSHLLEKQDALESMKVLAVPGRMFLEGIGVLAIFTSSLFYLVLLGLMILLFLLLSLRLESPLKRGLFLGSGIILLGAITLQDRTNLSFLLVNVLCFSSFYLLTLHSKLSFSLMDGMVVAFMMALISLSLFYGAQHHFFLKLRDRVLFDTTAGNRLVSIYYAYSPLAASPISPPRGVYQGLIYDESLKDEKVYYVGNGLFLTGRKRAKITGDFVLSRQDGNLFLSTPYGKQAALKEVNPGELDRAAAGLFDMKGLLLLTRGALYFFPAGLLILCLVVVRAFTEQKKPFMCICAGLTFLILAVIWPVTLTGNRPPSHPPSSPEELAKDGLSAAYSLFQKKQVPEAYIPALRAMTRSESLPLRYWGASLLGLAGDKKEAQRLVTLTGDESPNVRYMACMSLHKLLGQESFHHLIDRLLSDKSWYVRCRVYSIFLGAGLIPSPA